MHSEPRDAGTSADEKRDRLYLFSSNEFDSGFKNISRLGKHYDFETLGEDAHTPNTSRHSNPALSFRARYAIQEEEAGSEEEEAGHRRGRKRRRSKKTSARRKRRMISEEDDYMSEEVGNESDTSMPAVHIEEGAFRHIEEEYVDRVFAWQNLDPARAHKKDEDKRIQTRLAKSLELRFN